jgi:hypothetical protein
MNLPSHQDFLSSLNSSFRLLVTQNSHETLVLTSVTELRDSPASTPTHPKEQFSIIFEAEGSHYHPQQIYTFDHPVIGQFDIFIVPIGPDNVSKNMCYQAIFN